MSDTPGDVAAKLEATLAKIGTPEFRDTADYCEMTFEQTQAMTMEPDAWRELFANLRAAASLLRECAEREKALREALEKIANHATGGVGGNPVGFVQFAAKALEAK